MRNKILMTLALLLTAVTGAWAEEKMVTINSSTMSSGAVTATGFGTLLDNLYVNFNTATITTSEGVITKLVIKKGTIYVDAFTKANVGVAPGTITYGSDEITVTDINAESVTLSRKGDDNWSTSSVDVYYGTAEAPITVEPGSSANTWTFTMPGSDVVLTPIYAPTAQWAKVENEDQLPTAIEGVFAESTDAIVKAGTVAKIGETQDPQGIVMYAVTSTNQATAPALSDFSADVPTAKDITTGSDVLVWYYIQGADTPEGQTATAENTFNDSEICAEPIKVTVLTNKYDIQLNAANANTIEAGKATVTVGGTDKTSAITEGKLQGVKMGSEVKLEAKPGYKFRKVEVKKGGGEPVLLTTITAADNSSFKSGSQTFGDVATVTLTGDYLKNDGSHGGWYCQGSNLTATISVAEANGANITSVKFYTAGGGSAEDKDAPFEVTTTSMSSSDITTYLNGNSIGSYGVSKIEVYGTK